jgi:hypothetical protein
MVENNSADIFEDIFEKAHKICNRILLFEAIEMDEDEIRLFLSCNHVSKQEMQDAYLGLVREYDDMTSQ